MSESCDPDLHPPHLLTLGIIWPIWETILMFLVLTGKGKMRKIFSNRESGNFKNQKKKQKIASEYDLFDILRISKDKTKCAAPF